MTVVSEQERDEEVPERWRAKAEDVVGWHVANASHPWAALEPIRQGDRRL